MAAAGCEEAHDAHGGKYLRRGRAAACSFHPARVYVSAVEDQSGGGRRHLAGLLQKQIVFDWWWLLCFRQSKPAGRRSEGQLERLGLQVSQQRWTRNRHGHQEMG